MTFSLAQQIEEVDRELKLRTEVYSRFIAAGKMKKSVAEYHMERMMAVRATLHWLEMNEVQIKRLLKPGDDNATTDAEGTAGPEGQGDGGTTGTEGKAGGPEGPDPFDNGHHSIEGDDPGPGRRFADPTRT